MPITPYLEGGVFDAEATRAMGAAFERTCGSLGLAETSDPVTKLVAQKIIEAAREGERDPDKLHDAVLRWVGTNATSGLPALQART